ncbi:MAG: hypothetical protein HUJ63_09830, partial [Enterococcus sp.]|nr:hypothetical protein [Enterococcus sp.]
KQNKKDTHILYFSLEMAKFELMAKSISRNTYEIVKEQDRPEELAKGNREITTYSKYKDYSIEARQVIQEAYNRYSEYAGNINIIEGIGDISINTIKQYFKLYTELTNHRAIIFLDYLQITEPTDLRATDKQNMDIAVRKLKQLSREYKIPIVALSALNRESYKNQNNRNPVDLTALKESGGLEYGSDVILGLDFEDTHTPIKLLKGDNRNMVITILKNRNGRTSGTIAYKYKAPYNHFEEVRKVYNWGLDTEEYNYTNKKKKKASKPKKTEPKGGYFENETK